MDNYFSKVRGDNEYLTQKPTQKKTFVSGKGFELDESIRPEVLTAFKNLMDGIRNSDYYSRSSKIDNTRTSDYWSTAEELAARAFEAYLIAKSKADGKSNDYLANIEDEDVYKIANEAAEEFGAFEDPYPYPTRAEQEKINPLFDALFANLKTKETTGGNVALFSRNKPRTPFVAQDNEGYLPALNKVIDAFKSSNRNVQKEAGNTPIPISRTPVVLRQVLEENGSKPFKQSDYVVGQGSTLYLKANNIHSRSIHTGKIGRDVLERLPQLIADPIAVFKSSASSDDSNSFKVLIDAKDESGNPIIVAIKPNVPMQQLNGATVNLQATIFPTTWSDIKRWNEAGGLRYYNEKSPKIRGFETPLADLAAVTQREAATDVNAQEVVDINIGVSASKVKVVSRSDIEGMVPSAFSRGEDGAGMPKQSVQAAVDALRSNWKNAPQIIVVSDMSDLAIPEVVRDENERQLSQGATGQPEGFYYRGKVYIVANEMASVDDVHRVVFHETLGHFGLQGAFGNTLNNVLDEIYMLRRPLVLAKAKEYGLDFTNKSDRRIAAEEVLAEMAQNNPQIGFVKRAIAAIRNFLRSIGVELELTDNDIAANYLLPAHNYVANAKAEALAQDMLPAFNRNDVGADAVLKDLYRKAENAYDENTSPDDAFSALYDEASDKQKSILNALQRDDMLGFDYPHQAIIELIKNPEAYELSASTKGLITKAGNSFFSRNQTDTQAFKAWFGNSKVVDEDGKPLVVYRGDITPIDTFKGSAFFGSLEVANQFADPQFMFGETKLNDGEAPTVTPAYISIKNPKVFTTDEEYDDYVMDGGEFSGTDWQEQGFDGVIYAPNGNFQSKDAYYKVYSPTQIKSAIGNNGNFDPANPDIRFSRNEPFFSLGTGSKLELTKSKAQFGAKVLNKALVKYFGDDWSDSFESVDVPDTLLAYKEEVKVAFGKELRYVSPTNDRFDIFAGVQLPKSPNAIYVNARAETNLTTIAGHELYHTLERTRPDLHEWFKQEAQKYIKDFGVYHENLNKKLQDGEKPHKTEVAMSELLADFTGDALSDVKFLQELANADGNKFKGLLNATIRFLNQAILKLKNLASSRYITDVEAMRDLLKKALLAFANGNPIDTSVEEITIESEYKGVQYEQELADAERVFLSNLETKRPNDYFKHRGRATSFVKGTEKASRNASFDIDGNPEAPRMVPERLGKFSEFTSQALITKGFRGESILEVEFYGKEQEELGATDAPAIRVTLTEDGELTVYGAEYGSDTFGILESKGWASEAKQANGVVSTGTPFTRLDHVTTEQIQLLLGDVHARALAWGGVANTGMFWNRATGATGGVGNGRGGSVYFSRSKPQQGSKYALPEETRLDEFIRKEQNDQLRWKQQIAAIKERGGIVNDQNNIYQAMERMSARAMERTKDFFRNEVESTLKAMHEANVTLDQVGDYLYALHAKERNTYVKSINPAFANAGYGDVGGSGMSDREADSIIAQYQNNQGVVDTAAKFRAWADANLTNMVSGGLISQDQADNMRSTYPNYVPLRGFAESNEIDGLLGQGSGMSSSKTATRKALGRRSKADNPASYIIHQVAEGYLAAEKSNVGRYLERLINDNPDDSLWTINKPNKDRVMGANGMVTERDMGFDRESEVRFVRNNKEVRIQIKDPLLVRSYNNLASKEAGQLEEFMHGINGFLRTMWTQKNPVFPFVNMIRDIPSGFLYATGEHGFGTAMQMLKNIPSAWRSMLQYSLNKPITDPAMSRWTNEYLMVGGGTGFRMVSDIEGTMDKINRIQKDLGEKGVLEALANGEYLVGAKRMVWNTYNNRVVDFIEHLNVAFENMTRLAIYKAAREKGQSMSEASRLSKNATVNFNRKGENTPSRQAAYLFWNAAVQDIAKNNQSIFKSKHKNQARIILGTYAALGFALAMLGGDDDDLEQEESNVTAIKFRVGEKSVSIPISYGALGLAYYLGRSVAKVVTGEDADTQALRMTSAIFSHSLPVNPMSNAEQIDVQNAVVGLTPTAIQLPIQVALNRNSFGSAMRPDYNDNPDAYKSFRGTRGSLYAELAAMMNESTGGTTRESGLIDISPETLKGTVHYAFGGTGKFFADTASTSKDLLEGDVNFNHVPLANRFVKSVDVTNYRSRFYNQASEIKELHSLHNGYVKDGNREKAKEVDPKYKLGFDVNAKWKRMNALRDKVLNNERNKELSYKEIKSRNAKLEEEQIKISNQLHEKYMRFN